MEMFCPAPASLISTVLARPGEYLLLYTLHAFLVKGSWRRMWYMLLAVRNMQEVRRIEALQRSLDSAIPRHTETKCRYPLKQGFSRRGAISLRSKGYTNEVSLSPSRKRCPLSGMNDNREQVIL